MAVPAPDGPGQALHDAEAGTGVETWAASRLTYLDNLKVLLIAGIIAIHALPRFEHDDRIVRILALVVDAGARERGLGRALIAEAERTEMRFVLLDFRRVHHEEELALAPAECRFHQRPLRH